MIKYYLLISYIILSIVGCGNNTQLDMRKSMEARTKLIIKIKQQGNPNDPKEPDPIVSLEDFFEGNRDLGSIGCNIFEHPGIPKFYEFLKGIRTRDDVQDVFIAIHEIDESDESMWPFSECVYILTSAPKGEVEQLVAELDASEVMDGWLYRKPHPAPELRVGFKVYSAWWD